MSSVSTWILSIVGIIVLSILVDIILPKGKMSGFIKSIFGYLVIIVVLSPVFLFFSHKENISFNSFFETSNIEIQEEFVAKVNRQFLDNVATQIEKECEEVGLNFVEIGIQADIFENSVNITQISVDLSKTVIDKNLEHINVKTSITNIILNNIKVDEELIVFYE